MYAVLEGVCIKPYPMDVCFWDGCKGGYWSAGFTVWETQHISFGRREEKNKTHSSGQRAEAPWRLGIVVLGGGGTCQCSFHKHHHSWVSAGENNPWHVTHKDANPHLPLSFFHQGSTVLQASGSQMGVSNSSFGSIHFLNVRGSVLWWWRIPPLWPWASY